MLNAIAKTLCFLFVPLCVVNCCSFSKKPIGDNKYLHLYTEESALTIGETLEETDSELGKIYNDFIDSLPSDASYDIDEISSGGIGEVIAYIKGVILSDSAKRAFVTMFGVCILFCLSELMTEGADEVSQVARSVTAACLSLPILDLMKDVLLLAKEGVEAGAVFFGKLIPIATALLSVGTAGVAAGVSGTAMSFTLGIVSSLVTENLLPIGASFFCLFAITSFDPEPSSAGIVKGCKNLFGFFLGLATFLIVGTLALQTHVAAAEDSVTLRSLKFAASGVIPVVGSTVSGALSTLFSGVKLMSSLFGSVSVVAILSVMGAPLLTILYYRACIGVCSLISSFGTGGYSERFFNSLKNALDTVIAVVSFAVLVFTLEITVIAKCVSEMV